MTLRLSHLPLPPPGTVCLVAAWAAATVVLTAESKLPTPAPAPPDPEQEVQRLEARVGQAVRAARALQAESQRLSGLLAGTIGPPTQSLAEALAEARNRHDTRQAELERLEKQLAELQAAAREHHGGDVEELRRRLAQLEQERDERRRELEDLARREAELMQLLDENRKDSGVATEFTIENKKPKVIAIRRSLVAPLERPYFDFKSLLIAGMGQFVQISPEKDGVSLGEALAPGGWLERELAGASPENHYVTILLTPDSIATYYAAVKTLRQHKLAHTWITWDGETISVILDGKSDDTKIKVRR